jgi:hypothetical protein
MLRGDEIADVVRMGHRRGSVADEVKELRFGQRPIRRASAAFAAVSDDEQIDPASTTGNLAAGAKNQAARQGPIA